MTIVQLQVFLTVCEEKSFTKAGATLNMTQSAVSQAISSLEKELGVRLLVRDRHERHRIAVTPIGERIRSHARDIIQHTIDMNQEAAMAAGTERGTLRIATTSTVSTKLLPTLLASFRMAHPNVQITLLEGRQDDLSGWLANHRIDVGLTDLPMDNWDAVELIRDRLLLIVPLHHGIARMTSVAMERVTNERCILLKECATNVIKDAVKRSGAAPSDRFEMSDVATILEMVRQGIGVAILPELAMPHGVTDVARIALDGPLARDVGLVVRDMKRVSPICADFILHAREFVKAQGKDLA